MKMKNYNLRTLWIRNYYGFYEIMKKEEYWIELSIEYYWIELEYYE